nr:hypothetical protein Iba_chr15aCG13170 [Ipomoea batatas]
MTTAMESRWRPWKASEKEETADQPQKQPKEQRGKLCLELREKSEEYPLRNHQPEIPSGIPHSRSHNRGSEGILLSLREVVGASLPSPHRKEWGEGPRGCPPPHDHREPVFAGGAFLGEPARLNEESAVKEDQRHLSSSLQVASEKEETADQPQKQPKEQRGKLCLELREKSEEYPLRNHQPEIPSGIPHSRSHNRGSEGILLSLREVVGASLPSPHRKEWGEGPRGCPPPHDHREPVFAGGAFLGEPARLNEESAVKEDQRHLSSSLQVV